MSTKWLVNPFQKIAGWRALGLGIVIMLATAIFGKINHMFFDGVLDVHTLSHSFAEAFAAQAINLISVFIVMWLAGALFSRSKIRPIDIAGTMALSRAPMLFLALVGFLPIVPESIFDMLQTAIFVVICFIFVVWMITLMYHAFIVSCNIRGTRGNIVFIGALLVAEIISKCIFILLLGGNFLFFSSNEKTIITSEDSVTTKQALLTAEEFRIPEGQTIQQTAGKVIGYLNSGDYGRIILYFDEKMKEGVNSNKLRMLWTQLITLNGKFKEADTDVKAITREEYDILMIPCHFSQKNITLQLTFNKQGQISGLFIRPPADEK
ncbi:MAG: DUF3887 domain-containing protein [Bacteroidales bacterium]|jgi:hypothetical protein|nr:DUF3887 domain-containing protein [Bacteroidales bacterium]